MREAARAAAAVPTARRDGLVSERRNTRPVRAAQNVEVAAEVGRVTAALRTAIRLSGVSHREIERRLFLSTGYLTRILKGEVELRVRHVLEVLRIIGFPVGNFLGALFPATPPDSIEEARLARGLSSLHTDPEPPRTPEEIMDELRGCVRNLMELLDRDREQ